jgi:hypothetical protein
MQDIEPYFNWRNLYAAEEDPNSPFYGREYSEFQYVDSIYDHYIHPQWDNIGSSTLFIKILYADYQDNYAIIELIGEWNDCLHNDIMILKRDIIDELALNGINKFILIGENVFNFHTSDECYYEEWFEDVSSDDGWIAFCGFRDHVLEDFAEANIDQYILTGGKINEIDWRTMHPQQLYKKIQKIAQKRLN